MKGLALHAAESALDIEQARDIRRSVLCGELNWPREVVEDEIDQAEGAWLLLASLGPKPVASARLCRRGGAWHVEALAVLERFRRQGIGRAMLQALEAKAQGPVWASPPDSAAAFFERCGYQKGPESAPNLLLKNG